ncbi:50S ribosomal protein L4 [Tanacetum coccineum]
MQTGFPMTGSRGMCTSMLSSESSEGSFPSDLLSRKKIITEERAIGQLQDLVIPVTNFHNEDKGLMVLAGDVFDVPIRKDIIHRVVRWQLAKRQQGTHSTKTISEVSGTGRKPWRQKGTGRARHGSLRGPQFRHGAVMHGPKPRSHAFKLNKKVRRLGLKIALSARAAEGKASYLLALLSSVLLVFDDLELPTHKTKNIVSYVSQMEDTKKLLVVDGGPIDDNLKLATQNLHYVNVLPSIGLNVYSILLHDTLVMSRDAVNKISKGHKRNAKSYFSTFNVDDDPKTFSEAMSSRDAPLWKEAINDEMDSILKNQTWELAELPMGMRPIGSKWVFKKKLNLDGLISAFKARLVAKGYMQKRGIQI